MRKKLFWIVCLAVIGWAIPVFAQTFVTIEFLNVQFWPEYDRAEMLVITQIQLSADTQLPTQLSFKLPNGVTTPNAVANLSTGNVLQDAPYQLAENDGQVVVEVITDSYYVQIEYYDSKILLDGNLRTYSYRWEGGYQVDSFVVDIIPPQDGEILSISPFQLYAVQTDTGYQYSQGRLPALPLGESLELSVTYQRQANQLGLSSAVSNASVQPPPQEVNNNWAILLGLFFIIGVVYYIYIYFNKRSQFQPKKDSKPKKGSGNFCGNCGKQSAYLDKHCRNCGQRL